MTAFVITGTDTGVGKTVCSVGLTLALDGFYWKPIQSGLDDGLDSDEVLRLSGLPACRILPPAYLFETACSPHRAAEIDGAMVALDRLTLPTQRPLIIEGAGGALVPITRELTYADVMAHWGLPVIVVARTALGTINHTLLTIEALRLRGVEIHSVLFVGTASEDSEATIAAMGQVRRLGRLAPMPNLDCAALAQAWSEGVEPLQCGQRP